jgi:oligopeptide transport system substrate-binding protein
MLNRRHLLTASALLPLASCGRPKTPDNTLRIGIAGAPDSLDPLQGQFAAAALIYKQIYTPLTDYGPDGTLAPGLAKSWYVSDDGLQWTFELFENLRWSDGAPLSARDVMFSVRRALDPDTGYADAGDFYLIENAKNAIEGKILPREVGVQTQGDTRIVFRLTRPLGVFPELMREFYPVPAHILQNADTLWPLPPDFVGSGPYRVERLSQSRVVLNKNPFARSPANIETLDVAFIEEAATRARMVRAGDLDLTEDPPPGQIADLRNRPNVVLKGWPAPRLVYLKVNHAHAPLGDARVRRALSLAIDRDFIANVVLAKTASATTRIIAGRQTALPSLAARQAEARNLLADAGQKAGINITLMHSGGLREGIAIVLAQGWKDIGVKCSLITADPAGLYTFIDEGAFDLAIASFDRGLKREGWRMIEPFATDGFAANFNWTNPGYDQAVAATRAEADPIERDRMAQNAENILLGEAAIIPLLHEKTYWLFGPRLLSGDAPIAPVQWARLQWKSLA